MIFESERGLRRNRVHFGRNLDGLIFDNVELEIDDLRKMLDTPDHEIKRKLYDLYRCMEHNEHYRRRNNHGEYFGTRNQGRPSRDDPYGENTYREDPYHAQRGYTTKFDSLGPDEAAKAFAEASIAVASTMKVPEHMLGGEPKAVPKQDDYGLLWTED